MFDSSVYLNKADNRRYRSYGPAYTDNTFCWFSKIIWKARWLYRPPFFIIETSGTRELRRENLVNSTGKWHPSHFEKTWPPIPCSNTGANKGHIRFTSFTSTFTFMVTAVDEVLARRGEESTERGRAGTVSQPRASGGHPNQTTAANTLGLTPAGQHFYQLPWQA